MTSLFKFFSNAFSYFLELIFAISVGRKTKIKKGKREFLILAFLSLLVMIWYSALTLPDNQQESSNNLNDYVILDPNATYEASAEATGNETTQEKYLVTRVIDGDTFEIETGETVRLIGIDTPETVHPIKPVECYGPEASNFLKNLIENEEVILIRDLSNTDQYGRLLRYVYFNDLFINEELVAQGYANAVSYPPDVAFQSLFQEAEATAREGLRGLWGAQCLESEEVQGTSDSICEIKGNISWSGQKLYHLPECPYYEATVINEETGEQYFCSEQEALEAGFAKAANCP